MPVFEEVKVRWKDKTAVIPPDRLLRTLAKVEDVLTLADLDRNARKNVVPFAKLSMAFGIVLREAGIQVTDDEVYDGMFADEGETLNVVVAATSALLMMMLPPSRLAAKLGEQTGKKAGPEPVGSVPAGGGT